MKSHHVQVNYLEWQGEVLREASWCSIPFNESLDDTTQSSFYMIIASTIFFFIIPFIIVCCFYARICLKMRKSRLNFSVSPTVDSDAQRWI